MRHWTWCDIDLRVPILTEAEHWTWCDIDLRIPILTEAPPRSILVLSGRYHIMSNASIVNNCIIIYAKLVWKHDEMTSISGFLKARSGSFTPKIWVQIFHLPFQGSTSLWIFYVFSVLCLLCLCARLFICALWSPAGKGLTSWLSFVVSNCEFVTFPLVSWVRFGTWLYQFLIFVPLLTFKLI